MPTPGAERKLRPRWPQPGRPRADVPERTEPAKLSAHAPHLRAVRADDRTFLLALYATAREEELRLLDWSPAQREAFLRQQFDAQDHHYRTNYPGATLDVVLLDGQPVGRLYVARWASEMRIMDIALMPGYRDAGVGTGLLRAVIAEAEEARKKVSIHVEQFNPALRLYERLGFVPVAEHGVYLLLERPVGA
jgi:ribosomal protein S18 acetylase RimI-like enzyme